MLLSGYLFCKPCKSAGSDLLRPACLALTTSSLHGHLACLLHPDAVLTFRWLSGPRLQAQSLIDITFLGENKTLVVVFSVRLPRTGELMITSFLTEEPKLEHLGNFGLNLQAIELVQVDRTFVEE